MMVPTIVVPLLLPMIPDPANHGQMMEDRVVVLMWEGN